MQRRTIWDQSISSALSSPRAVPVRVAPAGMAADAFLGAGGTPDSRAIIGCRAAVALDVRPTEGDPITLQLNVPTHCINNTYVGNRQLVPWVLYCRRDRPEYCDPGRSATVSNGSETPAQPGSQTERLPASQSSIPRALQNNGACPPPGR